MADTYRPVHRTQLWKPRTGAVDCGPRSWQMALDARTHGRLFVGIDRLRRLAGEPGAQQTSVMDGDLAMRRLGVPHALHVNAEWDVIRAELQAGHGVCLCISYGVLTDLNPWRSGSPTFRGGHSLYIQELRRGRRDKRIRVLSFDSLYDGRRLGRWEAPEGPRWVRLDTLRRAAAAFSGRPGRAWALMVPHWRNATPKRELLSGGGPDRADVELEPGPAWDEPTDGVPFPRGSDGSLMEPWVPEDETEDDA